MSHEDERFLYLEGKIWVLQCLLGAALKASDIRDQTLDALIEQARDGYPASRDPEGLVGKGFNEAHKAVLNWRTRFAGRAVGMAPETTVRELARTLLQGMARYSNSPVVFNVRKAMETALASNDWPELERLACRMREAVERDVPTD